ncbi:MAG: zinc carboxypeptidase [bacterium]|nr:MAG: zinc carboxypeptidase [bacterium]
MFHKLQNLTLLFGIFLVIILVGIKFLIDKRFHYKEDKIRVGITIKKEKQRNLVKKFFPDNNKVDETNYIEVTTSWKKFFLLQKAGLEPELVLEVNKQEIIDNRFHKLEQIDSIINSLKIQYRQLIHVEKIGESAFYKLPIKAIKISDFPLQDEDDPSILFTAVHHANEPLSVEICLYIIDYLCQNYQIDPKVKHWVDNLESWIVPVINPDGYQLVMNDQSRIIWRKNLRDNNNDGEFTPEVDGVDLNRNYDYHWGIEGDRFPNSGYYPGPFAFSEPETQAIRDLAIREHFVYHLDFHSAGEVILYPFSNPQDEQVIATAKEIARNIKKRNGSECYSISPLNDKVGQCSLWMYHELGVLSFTVEAGDSYFPPAEQMKRIIEQNAKAVFWILNLITKDGSPLSSQRTLREYLAN